MGRAERISELEQAVAEANLTIQSQQETIKEYQKTIASFPGVKADYDSNLTKLTQQYDKEIGDLKNLVKATETSVNRRVTEALASIGVNTFASEEVISVTGQSPTELYQKFMSLKGAEQTEFYKKHEKEISKLLHAST